MMTVDTGLGERAPGPRGCKVRASWEPPDVTSTQTLLEE